MAEEIVPERGTIEAKDQFAMAPPGFGLTLDNERWPWGKPQVADPETVLREAVDSLEVPHVREEMMKLLMVGASVEALVEGYLFQAFQEGGFSGRGLADQGAASYVHCVRRRGWGVPIVSSKTTTP